jgi:hypothetical protein
MPEKRLKRLRYPTQLAKLMIDIASGEVEDSFNLYPTRRIIASWWTPSRRMGAI